MKNKESGLVSIGQYGTIRLQIQKYMDARHMTRNALARAVGTRFEVIDKWCRGDLEKIDADILARICCVLECSAGDLVVYLPPEKGEAQDPHAPRP